MKNDIKNKGSLLKSPLFLFFCASISYAAKEANENTILYAPLAGIHQNQSLFEPVLFSEKTPSTARAYVGDARNGGSGFAISGMIPLFNSERYGVEWLLRFQRRTFVKFSLFHEEEKLSPLEFLIL